MPENTDIRSFFDIPIEHFPDKSARWLLQDQDLRKLSRKAHIGVKKSLFQCF